MNYFMLREIAAVRRKSLILVALLVLADLCLILFLSLYQKPELERTQKEWFAKRDAVARGEDRGASARYREGERELAEFQKRFIAKKDFAAFLSELFGIARSNSLTIKGVAYKPGPVKGQAGVISYVIGFSVVGKYAGVKSFLADLARYPKLVTLDTVQLANSSSIEEAVDLKVQLTVYLKTEGA